MCISVLLCNIEAEYASLTQLHLAYDFISPGAKCTQEIKGLLLNIWAVQSWKPAAEMIKIRRYF